MTRNALLPVLMTSAIFFWLGAVHTASSETNSRSDAQWQYGILVLGDRLTVFESFDKFEGSNIDPLLELQDANEVLEMVGSRGWELVTVERLGIGEDQQLRWYFKRSIQ